MLLIIKKILVSKIDGLLPFFLSLSVASVNSAVYLDNPRKWDSIREQIHLNASSHKINIKPLLERLYMRGPVRSAAHLGAPRSCAECSIESGLCCNDGSRSALEWPPSVVSCPRGSSLSARRPQFSGIIDVCGRQVTCQSSTISSPGGLSPYG